MRIEQKKQKKKAALVQAAYELFMEKNIAGTSVSDITERAGVAKGTFYLYFRNKEDIVGAVVTVLCRYILENAYLSMHERQTGDFVENTILLADAILDYFRDNKAVLELIQRNFHWPVLQEKFRTDTDSVWKMLRQDVKAYGETCGKNEGELLKTLYCLVAMCGAVAYSSIICGEPEPIDKMKNVIFSIIRKALRP